jgi:undecaprenyl-diphosphatase
LAQAWLGIDASAVGHRFNVISHGGTLLAVLSVYRRDLLGLLRAASAPSRHRPEASLLLALFIATAPLALVLLPGVEAFVIEMESRPRWVGLALIVTATLLLVASRLARDADAPDTPPSPRQALSVGLVQLVAVLPGISRSGSTIAAALWNGMSPTAATRFSFLLSIPAVTGAMLKDAMTRSASGAQDTAALLVGFLASFVVGVLSLRLLLRVVARGRLVYFAPYLLVVGLLAVVVG